MSLEAVAKAAWSHDPAFIEMAKHLYGTDVTLEEVLSDIAKMDPAPADLHLPGGKKRKKDEEDVEKREFARGHDGKFISTGQHALRAAAEVTGAGVLAGAAGLAATKSPHMAGEAARTAWAAFHGVDHVSDAAKAGAKAVGVAGGGVVAGVAANENAQNAHKDIKSLFGGKKKHVLVKMLGEAVAKNLIKPEDAVRVAKDWAEFDAKRKYNKETARQVRHDQGFMRHHVVGSAEQIAGAVGLWGGARAVNSAGTKMYRAKEYAENQDISRSMATDQAHRALELKNHGDLEAANEKIGHAEGTWAIGEKHGATARKLAAEASRKGRVGLAAEAAGAGLIAAGTYEHHLRNKRQREIIRERGGNAFSPKFKKNLDEHEVTWEGEFSKVDDEKRQVFGWASVTEIDGKPVVDLQGDYIHPTEMERAAYDYVLKSRVGGDMHSRVDANGNKIEKNDKPLHVSDMIESMVFTPEKVEKLGLPAGSLPTGWWVGFQVNDDEVWKSVKEGGRKGFSIHGMGARMEKRLDEIGKSFEDVMIEKAWEYAEDVEDFADNLNEIYKRTGVEFFKYVASTLHPAHRQQIDASSAEASNGHPLAVGMGVGGTIGGSLGTLAGVASGKAEGGRVGGALGTLVGGGAGAAAAKVKQSHVQPMRPPSLKHIPHGSSVGKSVGTQNRNGNASQRQQGYMDYYIQQATQQMAPQVAQHIQQLQMQQAQQQMMEQQALQQAPQQQNWQTMSQMGPQQAQQGPSGPTTFNHNYR